MINSFHRLSFLILIIGLFIQPCRAMWHPSDDVCARRGAITECGEGILPSLDVSGMAWLSGTSVSGNTHVSGLLNAERATLDTMNVSGKASLTNTSVSGAAKISGLLLACHSEFRKPILIHSDRTHLDQSTATDIKISPGNEQQILCLGHNTIVNGIIEFTSGNGIVAMDHSSKLNGKVLGGEVSEKYFNLYCEGEALC